MQSRFHVALVFLGLRDDDRVEAELDAAPLSAWRSAVLVAAMFLGLALAFGALWLMGIDFTW